MMRGIFFFIAILLASTASAQETRTVNTRIADALALLPAQNSETAAVAYADLMTLDNEGLSKVFDGVRPSGDASGVPYRYAVALLSSKSTRPDERARIESALIGVLERSKDTEVKQYFISHLMLIGTDRSVATLNAMLSDQALANPATVALQSIKGVPPKPELQPDLQGIKAAEKHLRIAGLHHLVRKDPATSQQLLVKELDRFDAGYRRDVLNIAKTALDLPAIRDAWVKEYSRSKEDRQADILSMLTAGLDSAIFAQVVVAALDSKFPPVRKVAIRALGEARNPRYADRIAAMIINPSRAEDERVEATKTFLQIAQPQHVRKLATLLPQVQPVVAINILNIMAARRDVEDAESVVRLAASSDQKLRASAFAALPNTASPAVLDRLLMMLSSTNAPSEVAAVQQALIAIAGPDTSPQILKAAQTQKVRLLPVLPYLGEAQSLNTVKASFEQGRGDEKELAFAALMNWQGTDAISTLMSVIRQPESPFRARAFTAYVRQVGNTNWPADQKLLKLRELFPLATSTDERKLILRAAADNRAFLAFVFVSTWIDDPDLGTTAARATMRLALPTPEGLPGMTGTLVRTALGKVIERLDGPDSQYERIDVQSYLDQLPLVQGFEPLFNGKDLSGWQGLVENPIARAKMKKEELAAKQAAANAKLSESWSVKEGIICFTGTGDNLCTKRSFGDFEMIVDFKISKNGDSGIYLRGTPQVQIWDISRVNDGAQVGSGGLYNNTANRNPLVVADNPIGEWNTLRITMIGERVTVYLNGLLTVDNVVMENYWDRKIPIFPDGAIELQAHGTEMYFRDVFIREFNRPYQLSAEEMQQGFENLFNGRDLSGWVGNKTDYVVDDQVITIYPTGRGKGNLYTEKEYSDFVFRFEFQLTPAGNNGLGIHAPLDGDAAYVGKEIQILDDRHPAYKDIQPWQAHGSVYGIIAAKRDALRPVGQWNEEEVEVRGNRIKVTLNGKVIVDGDMKKASAKGTLDGKEHPGLLRHAGHIGFLGHGSVLRFRNIRVRDLAKK